MIKFMTLALLFLNLSAHTAMAENAISLNCSIKVFRPALGSASERVSLEKQAMVPLIKSTQSSDLQMMFMGQDIIEAYGARIVFMGHIFSTPSGDKIKLGIYSLEPSYVLGERATYWRGPVGTDLEGYYARPRAESTFKYVANGAYEVSIERNIGTRDNARATTFRCH